MKKYILASLSILVAFQACTDNKPQSTTLTEYQANWESLGSHQVPQWLMDAKFGIYAHWGVYSVPAYGNEWYAKRMYEMGSDIYRHHVETYGDPAEFGYKKFIPMFRAENYDPDEWAEIIAGSGAKFAGFAVVHHDGFCLWDSEHTRWNSVNMGPGRDLYGELVTSLRQKADMKVIATFHHIRTFNWYLPYSRSFFEPLDEEIRKDYIGKDWDIFDPELGDLYWNEEVGRTQENFINEWNSKVREVIDNYRPDVIWFDGGQFQDEQNQPIVTDLLSYYYNKEKDWQKEVEVLNKLPVSMQFNFPDNIGMLTFEEGRDRPVHVASSWIDDMKISDRSWGYIEGQQYKDPDVIIDGLVDRVSRGGGLVISLCPKADGTINTEQKMVLEEIGDWLEVNGQAIYGTRTWKIHAEGNEEKLITSGAHPKWVFDSCNHQDIRFTTRDNNIYMIVLGWPEGGSLTVQSLGNNTPIASRGIRRIRMLGSDEDLNWNRTDNELVIELPEEPPTKYSTAFRIEVRGELLK